MAFSRLHDVDPSDPLVLVLQDTQVSCTCRRDDDHVIGCCFHAWAPYPWTNSHRDMCVRCREVMSGVAKVKNICFDEYIGTWILRIYQKYQRYIGGYFYMNINISEINKNTLKFMEILCKSVKMTLIMKYTH